MCVCWCLCVYCYRTPSSNSFTLAAAPCRLLAGHSSHPRRDDEQGGGRDEVRGGASLCSPPRSFYETRTGRERAHDFAAAIPADVRVVSTIDHNMMYWRFCDFTFRRSFHRVALAGRGLGCVHGVARLRTLAYAYATVPAFGSGSVRARRAARGGPRSAGAGVAQVAWVVAPHDTTQAKSNRNTTDETSSRTQSTGTREGVLSAVSQET